LGFVTATLPTGFKHVVGRGQDTFVGKLVSSDGNIVIEYDIGSLAGIYAKPQAPGSGVKEISFRKAVTNGIPYQVLLATHTNASGKTVKTLYLTYPNPVTANFYSDVQSEAEIQRITDVILQLKPQKTKR
jgi:hypothetical protein